MLNASRAHFDNARRFEDAGQLDAAVLEYRRASEFDPSNRSAIEKVVQLERAIRDKIEAARPRPQIEELREKARLASAEPILNPASREPIDVRFTNAGVRDILTFISGATGINISYDAAFQDRLYTVNLTDVTLEQALNQIMTANNLFWCSTSARLSSCRKRRRIACAMKSRSFARSCCPTPMQPKCKPC